MLCVCNSRIAHHLWSVKDRRSEIVRFFKSSREKYGDLLRSIKNTLVSGKSEQGDDTYTREDIEFCNIPLQCVRECNHANVGEIALMLYTAEAKFAIVKMMDPSNTDKAHANDIILLELGRMNNFDFFGVPFPVNSEQYRLLDAGLAKESCVLAVRLRPTFECFHLQSERSLQRNRVHTATLVEIVILPALSKKDSSRDNFALTWVLYRPKMMSAT